MGEVEQSAERVLAFGLVIRLRRGRSAGEIGSAGVDYLLLRRVEVVHPHAEMIDADLLVAFLLEQRDVHDPVGHIHPAAAPPPTPPLQATFKTPRPPFPPPSPQPDTA